MIRRNRRALFPLGPLLVLVCIGVHGPLSADEPAKQKQNSRQWQSLFDGESLTDWEVLDAEEFARAGKVSAADGVLTMAKGDPGTGIRWTGRFPKTDFELALEGKRVTGEDFFCGLTFPVKSGSLTLILGGWGGWVVGLSCIDGQYAIENETCQAIPFERDQWYRIRVRVTDSQVRVWVDEEELVELLLEGQTLSVSREMKPCLPVGIATWNTTGAIRNLRYRKLETQ